MSENIEKSFVIQSATIADVLKHKKSEHGVLITDALGNELFDGTYATIKKYCTEVLENSYLRCENDYMWNGSKNTHFTIDGFGIKKEIDDLTFDKMKSAIDFYNNFRNDDRVIDLFYDIMDKTTPDGYKLHSKYPFLWFEKNDCYLTVCFTNSNGEILSF